MEAAFLKILNMSMTASRVDGKLGDSYCYLTSPFAEKSAEMDHGYPLRLCCHSTDRTIFIGKNIQSDSQR